MPELAGVEHSYHDLPTGVRVHLAAAGPPGAPPLLALHGWPQHWWCWRDVIAALGGEYRVLCPDTRGFGWSGWPADGDFRKQRVADDALALLDVLGIERAQLVGHDWGGWAAILAALTAPERFSGLLALGIGHPWVPRKVAARNAWRLSYMLPLATWPGRLPRTILQSARRDGRCWTAAELHTYLDALPTNATRRLYRAFVVRELPTVRAGRLEVPARLMVGRREPLGLYITANFPGEVELVDRAGHFLPEEAPGLVAERIRAMPPPARG
jgi:pimeloyl-ACP methyl ester carboxylesterase